MEASQQMNLIIGIPLIGLLIVLVILLGREMAAATRRGRAVSSSPQQSVQAAPQQEPAQAAPQPEPAQTEPPLAPVSPPVAEIPKPGPPAPQRPPPGVAYLEMVADDRQPCFFLLKGALTTMGRDPACDILLDESLAAVSRRHAQIERTGQEYILVDLDSNNGVFVNGLAVRRNRLRDGVIINIGRVISFTFHSNRAGGAT